MRFKHFLMLLDKEMAQDCLFWWLEGDRLQKCPELVLLN